jgi:hypothetical protein
MEESSGERGLSLDCVADVSHNMHTGCGICNSRWCDNAPIEVGSVHRCLRRKPIVTLQCDLTVLDELSFT